MNRKIQFSNLKIKGLSYQSIGNLFGISRQRVQQIVSGYISIRERKNNYGKTKEINRIFKKVFERDNYICQICGSRKRSIFVHHIDKNWQNNNMNNLVCLCSNCHLNLHRPLKITELTRKKMSEAKKKEKHPFWGKHHSEKTRKIMSENNARYWLGKKLSPETKRKMSKSVKSRIRKKEQFNNLNI